MLTPNFNPTSLRRDAWLEVDLSAIEKNITKIKQWLSPTTKLMAVVKGDAYGHGVEGVAGVMAASGVHYFGVASVDEACQLRNASIKQPILILSPCPFWALSTAIEFNIDISATSLNQLKDIASAAKQSKHPLNVHLKIDTGMHRLGIAPAQLLDALILINENPGIKFKGFFSHLAKADDEFATSQQKNIFDAAIKVLNANTQDSKQPQPLLHLASSDAAYLFKSTHYDMVRVGLALYGLTSTAVLQPAMSVKGRIIHTLEIEAGQAVGYNFTWIANRPSRLASIPIGYADGVNRQLSNHMEGFLLGQRIKQVGVISMDQMIFDISDVPAALEGDIITIIGSNSTDNNTTVELSSPLHPDSLSLAQWASHLDTITYELACRLKSRLPHICTRTHHG